MAPASTAILVVLLSLSSLVEFLLVLILIPFVAGRVELLAVLGGGHWNRIPGISLLQCRANVELITHIPASLVSHLQSKIDKGSNIQIELGEQTIEISPGQILDSLLHWIWRVTVSWNWSRAIQAIH